jgi:hypothetical protein
LKEHYNKLLQALIIFIPIKEAVLYGELKYLIKLSSKKEKLLRFKKLKLGNQKEAISDYKIEIDLIKNMRDFILHYVYFGFYLLLK